VAVAKYLRWREFIIAFFVMAFAASLPNLFIDVNAAMQHKPLLGLGDIIGGNLVDLTLVLAIAVFFSKKSLSAESDMVQKSAIFTTVIAVLPLLLILDGTLGRIDGVVLILAFFLYAWWLFSKSERFKKFYKSKKEGIVLGFKGFLWNIVKIIILLGLLLAASQAVVASAQFFSNTLGISLALVGILIVGLGNAFPELYFSVISARRDENWLVLGDLMGSVIICATLVLGVIGLLFPFDIPDFTPFFTARLILIIAALLSLIFIRTGRKITKKEGLALLFLYIIFLIIEVFMK
jgi:cation:H+ antiporter